MDQLFIRQAFTNLTLEAQNVFKQQYQNCKTILENEHKLPTGVLAKNLDKINELKLRLEIIAQSEQNIQKINQALANIRFY